MTGNNNMKTGKTSYSINYLMYLYDKEVLQDGKSIEEFLKKHKINRNSKEGEWLIDFDTNYKKVKACQNAFNVSLKYKDVYNATKTAEEAIRQTITSILKIMKAQDEDIFIVANKQLDEFKTIIDNLKKIKSDIVPLCEKYVMYSLYGIRSALNYLITNDYDYLKQSNLFKLATVDMKKEMDNKVKVLKNEAKDYGDYATIVLLGLF